MSKTLNINILGFEVIIRSTSNIVLEKLEKDFRFFLGNDEADSFEKLNINIFCQEPPFKRVPNIRPTFNRKRSITIDDHHLRYNNYEDELLSIFDFSCESAEVYSLDEDLLHEVVYLLILSRSGKWMDKYGIHKIHACGFQFNEINALIAMPMGEGKSTFFCELIKNQDVAILSDDTPLVDNKGSILPFPLRLGLCEGSEDQFLELNPDYIYTMARREYGQKTLISLDAFPNKIAGESKKQVLFIGKRVSGDSFKIRKKTYFMTMTSLFYHLIIGIGLPLIFEYFWETGYKDFNIKTKIFFRRLKAAHNLCRNSQLYSLEFGNCPQRNTEDLLNFLKKMSI